LKISLYSNEHDRRLKLDNTKFYLPSSTGASLSFDPSERIPWGVKAVHAPRLWRISQGERVRIGVVDTGADYQHPDIRASLMTGINLVNRGTPPIDDNGHGTHIAGTIAASCRTDNGIRGTAPRAALFPIKAFDRDGSAYVSDIILAIEWCIAERMDIINMSFGTSEYSAAMVQAVKAAHRKGIFIVASSGNNGKPNSCDYPARLPQTIAVGAINKQNKIAAFSNRGKAVDIYAPGEAIYSSWPDHRYHVLNGTSMAAAHVSGVAALLLAAKPRMKLSRLKRLLIDSAAPIVPSVPSSTAGRLDAARVWAVITGRTKKLPSKKKVKKKSAHNRVTRKSER